MRRFVLFSALTGLFILILLFASDICCMAQTPVPLPATGRKTEEGEMGRYKAARAKMMPIMMEFYADDCPFSRQMEPVYNELRKTWGDKVEFTKFNVNSPVYRDFAEKSRVTAVPTFMFIGRDGQLRDLIIGAVSREEIEKSLRVITEGGAGYHLYNPVLSRAFTGLGTKDASSINAMTDELAKYQAALSGHKPMIIDYYTTWCGWCRKFEPIFLELRGKWGNRIVFVKLDAEDLKNQDLVKNTDISGFPTIQFYGSEGKIIKTISGFADKNELEAELLKIASPESSQ